MVWTQEGSPLGHDVLGHLPGLAFLCGPHSSGPLTAGKPRPLLEDLVSVEIANSDLEPSLVRCWAILFLPKSD